MKKQLFLFKVLCIWFILVCFFIQPIYADDIDYIKNINSRAYVVLDRNSNTVLVGKNEMQKRKMASTTKIMTATIIIENCNLSDTVTISKKAANTGGSTLGLKTNDKITVRDLLYGLMLKSGNDAAVALAEYAGNDLAGFATLMNNKASELGLQNTHFETPHGLDSDNHYTTAYELALLSNYAMKNKTFANIVNTKIYSVTINGYPKTIHNTNELLGNLDGVYGIKTGFTNGANRCLVSCCKRGNMDVICVVLGADTKNFRTKDSIKLLEYVFKNFEPINIGEMAKNEFLKWKEKNNTNFSVDKGTSNSIFVDILNFENKVIPLDKDYKNCISIDINCDTNLIAPITSNYKIGEIVVKYNNKLISSFDISTINSISRKSISQYILEFLSNYPSYFENLY